MTSQGWHSGLSVLTNPCHEAPISTVRCLFSQFSVCSKIWKCWYHKGGIILCLLFYALCASWAFLLPSCSSESCKHSRSTRSAWCRSSSLCTSTGGDQPLQMCQTKDEKWYLILFSFAFSFDSEIFTQLWGLLFPLLLIISTFLYLFFYQVICWFFRSS